MASWGHTPQWKSKLGQTGRFYFSCRTTPLVSSCLLHALCQKISQLSGPNKGGKDAVDPGKPCVRSHRSWSPSTFPSTMRALSAPTGNTLQHAFQAAAWEGIEVPIHMNWWVNIPHMLDALNTLPMTSCWCAQNLKIKYYYSHLTEKGTEVEGANVPQLRKKWGAGFKPLVCEILVS